MASIKIQKIIGNVKTNEFDGVVACDYCHRTFKTENELDDHLIEHFERKNCLTCAKLLIRIGSRWYELHVAENCFETGQSDLKVSAFEATPVTEFKKEEEEIEETIEFEATDDKVNDNESNTVDSADEWNPPDLTSTENNESDSSEEELPLIQEVKKRRRNRTSSNSKTIKRSKRDGPYPRIKCRICEKIIIKHNFESHLLKMHVPNIIVARERVTCGICNKSFANTGNLEIHSNIHKGVKRFVCDFCGKPFRQLFHLSEHLNAHTGNKPYHCTLCDKRFGRANILKSHLRIHTGEKPHVCDIEGCSRAYAYQIDLKRHRFSVHGIYSKKHTCSFCSKVFSENKLLKKHLESHSVGNILPIKFSE